MKKKGRGRMQEWTKEEEAILVEAVLRQIRMGGTLRKAYQEAAIKIGRTETACEYHWKMIKKDYQTELEQAKEEEKRNREGETELNLQEVIHFLEALYCKASENRNQEIIAGYEAKIRSLEAELEKLREENKTLEAVVGTIHAALTGTKD
ncbi:hypothetical protein [Caldibacillus debilis]|uniref:Myb-like DNA-binding domain n=1 Tax=Caldibacillus debilis GB1 TaxID=1339248 RepID=A0A420VEB7_9BACI|nr:hypothetical protein [Caldibacillus debilis]RKO61748.1 Myb-like DNA-binding domain [Caldibacillus debilis GB1]